MDIGKPNSCPYNPSGVECTQRNKCAKCGWNTDNKELRQKRIEIMKRRWLSNVKRIKHYYESGEVHS